MVPCLEFAKVIKYVLESVFEALHRCCRERDAFEGIFLQGVHFPLRLHLNATSGFTGCIVPPATALFAASMKTVEMARSWLHKMRRKVLQNYV